LNEAEPEVEDSPVSSSGTADEDHDHANISAVTMQLNEVARTYTNTYDFIFSVFK
jgi:hypothetical protein